MQLNLSRITRRKRVRLTLRDKDKSLPYAPLHDLETVTVVTACEGVSPCPAVDVNHLLKIGSDHSRWLYRDADRVGES